MDISVGIKGFKHGTNINEVKIPEKLKERYMTGIKWFDEALGGEGMVPTTAMLLTGDPGAGKSTLGRQLADSITASGNVCLYNSGEESLYQVAMVAERLGLKSGFPAGQDTMLETMITHMDKMVKEAKAAKKQFFFVQDSLQTINDGKYKDGGITSGTVKRSAEMLVDWLQKTFSIGIIIGQVTKDGKFAGPNVVKHAFDVHGELYYDEDRKSETWGERLFEVNKNRWGCSGKTFIVGMEKTGLYEKGHFSRVETRDAEDDD